MVVVVVVVVFLPIIIPHQPSCFVLFCWLGCGNIAKSPESLLLIKSVQKSHHKVYFLKLFGSRKLIGGTDLDINIFIESIIKISN